MKKILFCIIIISYQLCFVNKSGISMGKVLIFAQNICVFLLNFNKNNTETFKMNSRCYFAFLSFMY